MKHLAVEYCCLDQPCQPSIAAALTRLQTSAAHYCRWSCHIWRIRQARNSSTSGSCTTGELRLQLTVPSPLSRPGQRTLLRHVLVKDLKCAVTAGMAFARWTPASTAQPPASRRSRAHTTAFTAEYIVHDAEPLLRACAYQWRGLSICLVSCRYIDGKKGKLLYRGCALQSERNIFCC